MHTTVWLGLGFTCAPNRPKDRTLSTRIVPIVGSHPHLMACMGAPNHSSKSAALLNTSGMRKLSSDQSSPILFCIGVPAHNRHSSTGASGARVIHAHDCGLGAVAGVSMKGSCENCLVHHGCLARYAVYADTDAAHAAHSAPPLPHKCGHTCEQQLTAGLEGPQLLGQLAVCVLQPA